MQTLYPSPEQVSLWEDEAHRRYPNFAMVLQFRQTSNGLEYNLHFQARDPEQRLRLPPLMHMEPHWLPLEMFWREGGSSEIEFLFGLFASEENLNGSLAIEQGIRWFSLSSAFSIGLCLCEAAATGYTAFWGSICLVYSLFWGFPLTGWAPLLVSGILQLTVAIPVRNRSKLLTALWVCGWLGGVVGTLCSIEVMHVNEIGIALLLFCGAMTIGVSILICKVILAMIPLKESANA
jgi:hypothetical protein